VVITTVGAVRRGGRATVGDAPEVALFRAGGVGAMVFLLWVVEGTEVADRMVVFANRSCMAVSLAIAAVGRFIG